MVLTPVVSLIFNHYNVSSIQLVDVNLFTLMLFSFLPKIVHFISKNAISCLFLENVSPSKRVICFILNNLHFPIVEGIAFYALYKSKVLVIPCKADDSCLFIGPPDEIYKKIAWNRNSIWNLIFSLFCKVTLRKQYIIKATWSVI